MDGQTDMTKLIITFRNFVNAPKKGKVVPVYIVKEYEGLHTQLYTFLAWALDGDKWSAS
jgi:hypothetical protein